MIVTLPGGLLAQTVVSLDSSLPDCWITRDVGEDGTLSPVCDLWIVRPVRAADPESCGRYWIAAPESSHDDSYLGPYTLDAVRWWCGTVPDSAHQVIKRAGNR